MSYMKHFLGEIETQISVLISYNSSFNMSGLQENPRKFVYHWPPLFCISTRDRKLTLCFIKMTDILSYTACRQLSQMFLAVFFFHSSEYFLAIVFHGSSNVTLKSLLISKNYVLAMLFSLMEYFVEIFFFPGLKEYWWISYIGLAMVIIGEIIRKLAIITAGQAFTHLIKVQHEEHHKLVTHGVYSCVRHPGYCGFLIWSVGTQIMLCNPISTIGFAIIVWRFFALRILYEEYLLRQFFGQQYEEYAQRVPSGVPFVE